MKPVTQVVMNEIAAFSVWGSMAVNRKVSQSQLKWTFKTQLNQFLTQLNQTEKNSTALCLLCLYCHVINAVQKNKNKIKNNLKQKHKRKKALEIFL